MSMKEGVGEMVGEMVDARGALWLRRHAPQVRSRHGPIFSLGHQMIGRQG